MLECVDAIPATIRTERVCKMFRGREEWIAWDDNIGCEPGCPIGRGYSKPEAIADLMEQIAEGVA